MDHLYRISDKSAIMNFPLQLGTHRRAGAAKKKEYSGTPVHQWTQASWEVNPFPRLVVLLPRSDESIPSIIRESSSGHSNQCTINRDLFTVENRHLAHTACMEEDGAHHLYVYQCSETDSLNSARWWLVFNYQTLHPQALEEKQCQKDLVNHLTSPRPRPFWNVYIPTAAGLPVATHNV